MHVAGKQSYFNSGNRHRNTIGNNSGYTLYMVMVLLSIAGTLFTVSLTGSAQAHIQAVDLKQESKAKLLAQSGLHRASFFYNGGDGHSLFWESPSLSETFPGVGILEMSSTRFGAFSRLQSAGICGRRKVRIEGLAGRSLPENLQSTITLTGQSGSIVFTKGTSVSGTVTLHHGVIKDGKKNPIWQMHDKVLTRNSPSMPFDCEPLVTFMKDADVKLSQVQNDPKAIPHSVDIRTKNDTLLRNKTLFVKGDCILGNTVIDNMLIVAAGDFRAGPGTLCRNSTVFAKRIIMEETVTEYSLFYSKKPLKILGGTHNSQFFSADTISIGKKPVTREMTVIVSYRSTLGDSAYRGGIFVEDVQSYKGTYICFTDTTNKIRTFFRDRSIVFPHGCGIDGNLITDATLSIKNAVIRGHIWAEKLYAEDDDKIYTNWLFGCNISPPENEPAFPLLGETPARVATRTTDFHVGHD